MADTAIPAAALIARTQARRKNIFAELAIGFPVLREVATVPQYNETANNSRKSRSKGGVAC
jgi:hypothetical protein